MSSTKSSLKPIDKVSSDNLELGFDLLSNLTYMSVLSLGSLPSLDLSKEFRAVLGTPRNPTGPFGALVGSAKRNGYAIPQ